MQTVDIRSDLPEYKVLAYDLPLIDSPLWWHERGLMQTSTGFGRKLTTRYKVEFEGKQRRIYCTQFSNSGSLWFTVKGKRYFCN